MIDRLHDLLDRFVLTLDELRARLHERLSGVRRLAGMAATCIVWPFEWLTGLVVGLVVRLFERFDFVEEALGFLVFIILWPFHKAAEWAGRGAARVAPKVALGAVDDDIPEGPLEGGLEGAIFTASQRLQTERIMDAVRWVTQPFWRPVAALVGFVHAWMVTRPLGALLWGLPVVVILAPILAAVVWGAAFGQGRIAARYREAAEDAREAKDFEAMALMERKLSQLGADSHRTDFQTAADLAENGELADAFARMKELAPDESAGFPQAHFWIAVHLLENKLEVPEEDRLRLAEVHIGHLKSLGYRGEQYDALQRSLLVQGERWEELAEMLEPLITRSLTAATARLELDIKLNRPDEANRDARAARTLLEDMKRRGDEPTPEQYRVWAVVEDLVGDRLTLGIVLREWLEADPENADARRAVAALAREEFDSMLQSPQPNAAVLGDRLIEIATLTGQAKAAARPIATLLEACSQRPALLAAFRRVVDSPKAPLGLLAAIGTLAEVNGQVELARDSLVLVVKADPNHAIAWNNYAWALAQDPAPDYDAALAASNRALELVPNQSRFLETRGQIYVSLGMWREAVADLEIALNGMPNEAGIHAGLVAAYDALGQHDMAAIHRQQMR